MTTRDTAINADFEQTLGLLGDLLHAVSRIERPDASLSEVVRLVHELKARPQLHELPAVMRKVYAEITEALAGIRATRQTIQTHSLARLKDTHERLTEVSSTTENAALEMLNGLDRSLALVDSLEQGTHAGAEGWQALREEVNQLYGHLQFQDIIAQQLHGVTALLADIEGRMQAVATLFDEAGAAPRAALIPVAETNAYNADAKFGDSSDRQALADAAFLAARGAA